MSAYGHQRGRIMAHWTAGSTGRISHPSSDVLARVCDIRPRIPVNGRIAWDGVALAHQQPEDHTGHQVVQAGKIGRGQSSQCGHDGMISVPQRSAWADVGPGRVCAGRAVPVRGGKDAWAPELWLADMIARARKAAGNMKCLGLKGATDRKDCCVHTSQATR